MDVKKIGAKLSSRESLLLKNLPKSSFSETEVTSPGKLSSGEITGTLGWLKTKDLIKEEKEVRRTLVSITDRGKELLEKGMPELKIMDLLRQGKMDIGRLSHLVNIQKEELNPILSSMKKRNVISFGKGGIILKLEEKEEYEKTEGLLRKLRNSYLRVEDLSGEERKIVSMMSRKRGKEKEIFRVREEVVRHYRLTPQGAALQNYLLKEGIEETISALTAEMLENEFWRNRDFKEYNIKIIPPPQQMGRRHPYALFLSWIRRKLMAMGFKEMKGNIVEPEFWNNDALFMPQDHPAREMHDVYFVKEPKTATELPGDLVDRVAQTHINGWQTGSTGWGYKFDKERTRRLVLRSQGTAISARMLASKPEIPGKYFAIARCFRYDRVDATHAPDFYQIEGIVLSQDINLRHLLELLRLFALDIAGSEEIKFVPYYFPFTEPSIEVQFKHPRLGWMELGGAGMFRKEVTLPLGIDVPVIAWGLGLDRMAMVTLGIRDIRDLFTSDLGKIQRMKSK
ncbi:MAG: Phenylalanine--tRNA ligase alpha subunit [Syntrophomonadaceae bacterium]|nr:Phenylalanine--tRNA ligase alpha subunit [Bacillota bacterium]MBT9147571.1 Phenylalanine--tRNA ligase alpha subunit [Bacillota bacterium]